MFAFCPTRDSPLSVCMVQSALSENDIYIRELFYLNFARLYIANESERNPWIQVIELPPIDANQCQQDIDATAGWISQAFSTSNTWMRCP